MNFPANLCDTRRFVLFAGLFLLVLCPVETFSIERIDKSLIRQKLGLTSRRSSSGHFIIVGPDEAANQELAGWADDFAEGVEKLIGLKMSFAGRAFKLVIREDSSSDVGSVRISQQIVEGKFSQRLVISGYTNAVRDDVEEAFCRLLLNGYLAERRGNAEAKGGESRQVADMTVPAWLSRGIAQNLSQTSKSRNSRLVHERWRNGQLPILAEFLKPARDEAANEVDSSLCGVFTAWLLSVPNRSAFMDKIFWRLSDAGLVSMEWLASCFPDCGSVSDLDEKWDNWLLKQKNMVYDPGKVNMDAINQLRAQLLLYRGEFGIPPSTNMHARITFGDFIREREANWIPGFVESKCAALRFLAVGKGDDFRNVVESYCRFMEAAAHGKAPRQLEKLLKKANDELNDLRKKVEPMR